MRLFQFAYSPYVAKVRKCLELKGLEYEAVDVPYLDRRDLIALTGGYGYVPVLEDGGRVVTDSSRITAYLDERYPPSLRAGPLGPLTVIVEQWAEGPLEDGVFRVACPGIEARFASLQGGREDARVLFRLMKERKYGTGCIEAWKRDAPSLSAHLEAALTPVAEAVASRPFLLGDLPTLADAAVYGQLHFLEVGTPGWLSSRMPALSPWFARIRDARAR